MYQIYFILEWHSTCFGRSFSQSSDTAVCFLASRQQYLIDMCLLLYVQSWTADDGWEDRSKHVECHSKRKQIWYIGASSWFYYRNNILPFFSDTTVRRLGTVREWRADFFRVTVVTPSPPSLLPWTGWYQGKLGGVFRRHVLEPFRAQCT